MGYYINPVNESKEEFLRKHGIALSADEVKNFDFSGGTLPVCLIDNLYFTAAAIAYDAQERDCFLREPLDRPKKWFGVRRDWLKPWYFEGPGHAI